MTERPVTIDDVRTAIDDLELSGRPVCIHASLRSFGWVDRGASTIVDAFLSRGCTVLVPSFTERFAIAPPANRRYTRNGCDYDAEVWPGDSHQDHFSPDSTDIDGNLGLIPAAVVARDGRVRGDHPQNSFTAVGPLAQELIDGQTPMRVYAPLDELARRDGSVILMGIDLTAMTLIHLAEQRAGRKLFRRWSRGPSGDVVECLIGSCSEGFEQLRPALLPVERTLAVGRSLWRIYSADQVLERAVDAIRRDPEITRCSDPNCTRCHDAILGGPIAGEVVG